MSVDFTSAKKTLDGLPETFKGFVDAWQEKLTNCAQQVDDCENRAKAAEDRLEQLGEQLQECLDVIQEHQENVQERVEEWGEHFDELITGYQERFEQSGEAAVEMIKAEFDQLGEECGKLCSELEKMFRQQLHDQVDSTVTESEAGIKSLVEENITRLLALKSTFSSAVKEEFTELRQYVGNKVVRTMEDEVRRTGEAAIERIKDEVVNGIAESQIQVQITGMISSILPQLAAAKRLAPAIRRALELMRAGF